MAFPLIQARNYTPASGRTITLVVIHDMEHPETPATAREVAAWFASASAPQASAHYCIDNAEIVQCVKEKDVAWHAPGANAKSIGLEHAGYANQTSAGWSDAYSEAMLRLSARLTAEICSRYAIPIQFLTAADLVLGGRGITTHAEVSKAWKRSDHTDPGPNFPMAHYLDLVRGPGQPTVHTETFPIPVHDFEELAVKQTMVHIGPLDKDGNGWADWQPGLGRDPNIVAVVQLGPSPPDDNGYWPGQAKVNLSAQPRGGAARIVVRNGTPGDTVTAFVTVS